MEKAVGQQWSDRRVVGALRIRRVVGAARRVVGVSNFPKVIKITRSVKSTSMKSYGIERLY